MLGAALSACENALNWCPPTRSYSAWNLSLVQHGQISDAQR